MMSKNVIFFELFTSADLFGAELIKAIINLV